MSITEQTIYKFSLQRIADVFSVPVNTLHHEFVFGVDLKAKVLSGLFVRNEYDQIEGDILDVSDRSIYRSISSGKLTIHSVGDYCSHMLRCYQTKPKDVISVLKIPALIDDN